MFHTLRKLKKNTNRSVVLLILRVIFQKTCLYSLSKFQRDLVPIVQFKKREKHPWRSIIFNGCFFSEMVPNRAKHHILLLELPLPYPHRFIFFQIFYYLSDLILCNKIKLKLSKNSKFLFNFYAWIVPYLSVTRPK